MNALVAPPTESAAPDHAQGPLLRTLVLCDLANSTALVERLGDQAAAALMRRHDRLARDLVLRHGGQEIDKTDGFLVMFERPIQGVAFALDYQRDLRRLGKDERLDLRARVGLHVGDVLVWENNAADVAHGAKPMEVEGLVKPVAARLAGLARPGQILVSGVAASLAQRAHTELAHHADARWMNHGRYRFKGVPEPLPVYEIGEAAIAPLSAPPWSSKAHREVPWWRRPASVVVEALVMCTVIAAMTWWLFRPPPAIAFARRDWVVVGSLKNLTSEPRFDDALQTAFRIGLEQSRFVNVLPELQVRDALRRMERDPASAVDRIAGSEIALREGAKALILPTVAEIGGKLRVTAEVIDPATQATVYSDSAEGDDSDSALTSLDAVGQRVRARLGETLAQIAADGQPLPKVTSGNLDALRAYALGTKAILRRNFSEALSLFDQALKLDPGFAMARVGKARVYLSSDDHRAALKELTAAQSLRERLSSRDGLYFDALLATYSGPAAMLEKWRVLGSMYPDLYFAHTNYAQVAWVYTNNFDEAIEAVKKSFADHNDAVGVAHYLLATLYLGKENFAGAAAEMAEARKAGRPLGDVDADLAAAQRDFAKAKKVFEAIPKSGVASDDLFHAVGRIAVAVDTGDAAAAQRLLADAQRAADSVGPMHGALFRGMDLSLKALAGEAGTMAALKAYGSAQATAANADDTEWDQAAFSALFAAYLLAKGGDGDAALRLADEVKTPMARIAYPLLEQMQQLVRAEIQRRAGHAEAAVALLHPLVDGTELTLVHAALMEAWRDQKDWPKAIDEARWLAAHRGRAYAEHGGLYLQRPYEVALSDLALLDQAEFAARRNDKVASATVLRDFESRWPEAGWTRAVSERVERLRHQGASP